MCDYSLHAKATRAAAVDDKLVTATFPSWEGGYSEHAGFMEQGGDKNTAVCLLPGTQVVFDEPIKCREHSRSVLDPVASTVMTSTYPARTYPYPTAVLGQYDMDCAYRSHDYLEFPDGERVALTALLVGQTARVLQLPVTEESKERVKTVEIVERLAAHLDAASKV